MIGPSRFVVLPVLLMLVLGTWAQPALNVFNISARGVGIVHVYRLVTTARKTIRSAVRVLFGGFSEVFGHWRSFVPIGSLIGLALAARLGGDSHHALMLGAVAVVSGPSIDANKYRDAYAGRNSETELFDSFPHTGAVQTINPARNISINRPLEAMIFNWKGRVVIAGANYTTAAAESPMTILDTVQITGTYKGGNQTPLKMSGSTLFAMTSCYSQGNRGSSCYITTGGGAQIRQSNPGIPFAQTLANFGNTGTYDIEINYIFPTWPMVSGSNRARTQIPYLWQPDDWGGNSIQLQFGMGDKTSFGTPAGGTTVTFTGFGSATGTPILTVFLRYVQLGNMRPGNPIETCLVTRNEYTISAGMATVGNNVLIRNLTKQITTNLLLKIGVVSTVTTSPLQTFLTLDDYQIDKTLVTVDGVQIRKNYYNPAFKESVGFNFGSVFPQGYFGVSFIDSQNPRTAFRADKASVVSPSSSYLMVTDVIKAGADQRVNFMEELILIDPNNKQWSDTR